MEEIKITKEMINENRHVGYRTYGVLYGYCHSHDGCETCNKRVRFFCKIKVVIEKIQTRIIKRIVK